MSSGASIRRELVGPFAAAKATPRIDVRCCTSLKRKMPLAGADLLRRLGKLHARRTEHGPRIAAAEGGERSICRTVSSVSWQNGAFGVDADFADLSPRRWSTRRTVSQNAARNASMRLSSIFRPAAAAWPPWPSRCSRASARGRACKFSAVAAAGRADARLDAQLVERQSAPPGGDTSRPAGRRRCRSRPLPAAAGQHQRRVVLRIELLP